MGSVLRSFGAFQGKIWSVAPFIPVGLGENGLKKHQKNYFSAFPRCRILEFFFGDSDHKYLNFGTNASTGQFSLSLHPLCGTAVRFQMSLNFSPMCLFKLEISKNPETRYDTVRDTQQLL